MQISLLLISMKITRPGNTSNLHDENLHGNNESYSSRLGHLTGQVCSLSPTGFSFRLIILLLFERSIKITEQYILNLS